MSLSPVSTGLRGALLAVFLLSCSSSSSSSSSSGGAPNPFPTQQKPVTLFSKTTAKVVVEVDYVTGAKPYVGAQGGKDGIADIWGLAKSNVTAIFETKQISIPTKLTDMEELTDIEAKNYSEADIIAIAKLHRDTLPAPADGLASFYIVFLPGNYIDASGNVDEDRLAVSIGETGVIGMFRPAIDKPAGNTVPPPAYVEQLALIHEMGHAVGFVNNGVPIAATNTAHEDPNDPHHCTNTQCAMASGVDTVQGAAPYAMKLIRYQTSVLIGQECLSDARILANNQN